MTTIDLNCTVKTPEQQAKELIEQCLKDSPLRDDEHDFIVNNLTFKFFKKGTILLQEGEHQTYCYHNFKGCIRQVYLKDGEEKTTFFYTEDMTAYSSGHKQKKIYSPFYLECTEDTIVGMTSYRQDGELFRKFPRLEAISRMEVEEQLASYQQILASYIISSPKERYLNLLETRPDLLARVPQKQIASYLGIQPESLSRIRRRVAEENRNTLFS